jgi:hypothetical protein
MGRKSTMIDAISIPKPCPAEWDSMTGTRRVRHCQECNKNVHNLSAMTRDEAEALIARFEGRLCARIERDDDGVILDDDFRAAPQLISRRVSPVAATLVTALLGLSGNVMAMTSHASAPVAIQAMSGKDDRAPQPQGGTATISGVVKDSSDAIVPNAKVTLINEATGEPCGTTTSDAEGSFSFASLAEGKYTIKVEAAGFAITHILNVEARADDNARMDVSLNPSTATVVVGGAMIIPQPLRALHHKSDLIVVARLGRSASVKTTETNKMMKTTLEVTSVVKGDNKRSRITVYNWGWGENKEFPGGLKTGDTALFFLKPRAEGDGFEISDYSYGVKKLAPADLRVYLQRLEELNAMAQAKQPGTAAIVEWLVRCAEQRATRWDGAYEMVQTADDDADDQSDAEDSDEPEKTMEAAATINQAATSEPANPSDAQTATNAPTCSKPEDQAHFAARLSDEQKSRLKAALFSIEALTEKDMILVTLVQHWKDARFVPFLLEQLRRVEASPPPLAERIIDAIAEAMHDEEVKALAEDYSNNVSYAALDAKAEADSPEAESVDREAAETEDSDETSDTASDEAQEAMTARQERSAMLQRFIAFVEKKRAN